MDQHKTCPRCRETKPREAFSIDRHAKDGRVTYCKACVRARNGSVLPRRPPAARDEYGKTCPRCCERKAWSGYNKSASAGDGHQSYCRECATSYERESDERNAEALRARHAEKLARNPDKGLTKVCHKCEQAKPLLEFYAHRSTADGRANYCTECAKTYQRAWNAAKRDKIREYNQQRDADPVRHARHKQGKRERWLKLYGMTPSDYDALLVKQDSVCAICGEPGQVWAERNLHVDHDHETNEVRGLLCGRCNLGISYFRDNTDRLGLAIAYLNNPPARPTDPP